ncbi:MFS general substrate transporter [Atractiella rhizophila]|nr:MFS general substrate transporter [Atractiella rhizophila]
MGRYQWELFFTAGLGWYADNIWLQGIAIIMPAVSNELKPYPEVRLATLALYAGLIVGATFWGCSCDIIGRRLAWNATLLIGGIFGIAAGAAPNFTALCFLLSIIGFGVGGNLPVDGALFLEFLPSKNQYLLTLLSVWWAIGQVIASLISWAFLAKYSCDPLIEVCTRDNNAGWRYAYYTLGAHMVFLSAFRLWFLPMDESPKFLCSIGRDQDAVEVIHKVARKNGRTSTLTVEDLRRAAAPFTTGGTIEETTTKFSTWELIKHSFDDFTGEHIRGLFATPRLAWNTSLVIYIYASLGLAYPLFNGFLGQYLSNKKASFGDTGIDATYSTYTYQAACGIPGSLLAALLVEMKRGGRKFAMAFFTVAAGICLFGLTQVRTPAGINGLTSIAAFFENAFYGVIYAYSPEVFPSPHRGTGDAIASASSRITGIFSPVIAIYSAAAKTPDGPVFASAAIFVSTGLVMLLLPIETAGKAAL